MSDHKTVLDSLNEKNIQYQEFNRFIDFLKENDSIPPIDYTQKDQHEKIVQYLLEHEVIEQKINPENLNVLERQINLEDAIRLRENEAIKLPRYKTPRSSGGILPCEKPDYSGGVLPCNDFDDDE